MKNIYEMMIQTNCLSNLIKTQCLRDSSKFFKYHQQFGHVIDHCKEFHDEMKRMVILSMLRL
jgi:hypothetical protein